MNVWQGLVLMNACQKLLLLNVWQSLLLMNVCQKLLLLNVWQSLLLMNVCQKLLLKNIQSLLLMNLLDAPLTYGAATAKLQSTGPTMIETATAGLPDQDDGTT